LSIKIDQIILKKNWTIDLKNFLVDLYYEEFALL
jgi:hypothetical protein